MLNRENYKDGTVWEDKVSYSRAVKIGNIIEVSGTVSSDNNGNVIGLNKPYLQTKTALEKIENSLKHFDADRNNIIRTRMFVTDIEKWEEFGKAHGEFFRGVNPTTSMVEVSKFISEEFLIEIEATAIINKG